MAETLTGACLCGGVEYEVTDPQALGYCHCTRCQRWTGESLAGVVVDKDNFRFTKGEELVKTYESEFALLTQQRGSFDVEQLRDHAVEALAHVLAHEARPVVTSLPRRGRPARGACRDAAWRRQPQPRPSSS